MTTTRRTAQDLVDAGNELLKTLIEHDNSPADCMYILAAAATALCTEIQCQSEESVRQKILWLFNAKERGDALLTELLARYNEENVNTVGMAIAATLAAYATAARKMEAVLTEKTDA